MGWESLSPPAKTASGPKAPVRVGMRKFKTARAKMVVIVVGDVLEKMGGTGGKAQRYRVELGTAAEAHNLRVTADQTGLFSPAPCDPKTKRYFRFVLPAIARLPDFKVEIGACDYKIDKNLHSLTIDLPSWAFLKRAA